MFSNLFLDIYISGIEDIKFFKPLNKGHCKTTEGRGERNATQNYSPCYLKKSKLKLDNFSQL